MVDQSEDSGGGGGDSTWHPPAGPPANVSDPTDVPPVALGTAPAAAGAAPDTTGTNAGPSPYAGMYDENSEPSGGGGGPRLSPEERQAQDGIIQLLNRPNPAELLENRRELDKMEPEHRAALTIGLGNSRDLHAPEKPRPVDLSTPESTEAVLNHMVQNGDPNDKEAENRCGPAAVLAGAMKAGGIDGVKAIVGDLTMTPDGQTKDLDMTGLQERLENGQLTTADLSLIQGKMYEKMKSTEAAPGTKGYTDTVGVGAIQHFIAADPALAKMYADSKEEIDLEDTDGSGKGNHYVMKTRDDSGKTTEVYNPYRRIDGNQVTNDPDAIHDYELAQKLRIASFDRPL